MIVWDPRAQESHKCAMAEVVPHLSGLATRPAKSRDNRELLKAENFTGPSGCGQLTT